MGVLQVGLKVKTAALEAKLQEAAEKLTKACELVTEAKETLNNLPEIEVENTSGDGSGG